MIPYFVAYEAKDVGRTMVVTGNAEIKCERPIACIDDVRGLQEMIADKWNLVEVIVVGWQRFENQPSD